MIIQHILPFENRKHAKFHINWFINFRRINFLINFNMQISKWSVAVAWSVESLPSNPLARVRFPAGSGILIPILGLGVCPFSVFCLVLSSAEVLTLCWPHIQGGPPFCICLVFWSKDCWSPFRYLTHRHLGCKSLEVKVLDWGRVNKRRRRKS